VGQRSRRPSGPLLAIPGGWTSRPAQVPDILYAHGLPLMAKAIDDILTHGEVLPF
jgi:hypothetical protein